MPGILWIASYPKSGNTWMRIFLANLILDAKEPLEPIRANEVCTSEANKAWHVPFVKDGDWSAVTDQDIADHRLEAQRRAVKLNKKVVLFKTHNFLGEFMNRPLCAMDVTAAALYIIRDPRDVAVSAANHFGVSIDETIKLMSQTGARSEADEHVIYEVYNSWSNHVKSWTQVKHPKLIVLRYEDMLADPYGVFTGLAKKLGITQDEARIRRAVEHSSFKQLQTLEEEKGFAERSHKAERFFRSGKSGGWRDVLTKEQVARIEKDHKVQMKRFGYL